MPVHSRRQIWYRRHEFDWAVVLGAHTAAGESDQMRADRPPSHVNFVSERMSHGRRAGAKKSHDQYP